MVGTSSSVAGFRAVGLTATPVAARRVGRAEPSPAAVRGFWPVAVTETSFTTTGRLRIESETVGLIRATAVTGLLVLLAPQAARLFGQPHAAPIIQALALRTVVDAGASIGVAKLTRALAFRQLAIMAVTASLVDATTAIALAPRYGVWALVFGTLAGATTQTVLSYSFAPHRPRLHFDFQAAAPPWAVVLGFAVSTAVGIVFGLWPAILASRKDPIEALRYE